MSGDLKRERKEGEWRRSRRWVRRLVQENGDESGEQAGERAVERIVYAMRRPHLMQSARAVGRFSCCRTRGAPVAQLFYELERQRAASALVAVHS